MSYYYRVTLESMTETKVTCILNRIALDVENSGVAIEAALLMMAAPIMWRVRNVDYLGNS